MATRKDLRRFLLGQPPEPLADWLLDIAKDLPDFRHRLEFYAATHGSPEAAQAALNAAIEDFNALLAIKRKLKSAEITKPACVDFGYADIVLPLAAQAMLSLDRLIDTLPASFAGAETLQREFATLHLNAATAAKPEAKALAQSLFDLRSDAIGPILPDAPAAYKSLLGPVGLGHFRRLLDPAYQVLVNRSAPERRSRKQMRAYMNQRVMLYEWTLLSDDIDEQVAILLSMARQPEEVLMIAGFLENRNRPIEAIQTVRQAQERVPHPKLATYLAKQLERQGQAEEALPYRWFLFEKSPSLESFDALPAAARERAMDHSRENAKTLYVDLLLREDRPDEALAAARESGVPISTWAELARRHQGSDPRLAIQIYFDCVEFALNEKRAAEPAEYAHEAWQLASDTATFQVFNARLRALFGTRKLPPGFREELNAAGIPVAKLLQ